MDYEAIAMPYDERRVDNLMGQDGAIDTFPAIATTIKAKQLIKNFNDLIEDSLGYWDDTQGANLHYARAQSVRMVLGKQIDVSKLYRYQIPYIDNELHIAIDAIISYASANTPRPEVVPAGDGEGARILAKDLEKAMEAHSDLVELSRIFETATYNVLTKRVGIIKLWYDPDYGRNGEILVEAVDPNYVIIDKNAKEGRNPAWICEIHKNSLEELMEMFPSKKQEIFDALNIKRGTPRQMSAEVVWREIHATVYQKGKPVEWVFCYTKDIMLDMFKDPNWVYGDPMSNFMPMAQKMYIPLNYMNDGNHWIDNTTPVEQAYSMQDVLNKRGRQIMENADTANGFLVFSDDAVTTDDVENLVGDPNQKLTIHTQNTPISQLVQQIPPHMLPSYVLDDKIDTRNTLHNIMGTPAQFTGAGDTEQNKTDTLGQAIMIKNQASGRQDRLVRAVERCAKRYFNALAQMMRVHYDERHWFVYDAGDGDFDRIAISRTTIDPDMQVIVRGGTTLPFDKDKESATALNLAKMGLIAPLDLYKDLGMDKPQRRYDDWVKWKTAPQDLAKEAADQEQDDHAYVEFMEMLGGNVVKPYEEADMAHILTHRKQLIDQKFLSAKDKIKKIILDHVQMETQLFQARNALDEMSAPPMPQQPPMGAPGMPPGGQPPMPGAPQGPPPQGPPNMAAVLQPQPPQGIGQSTSAGPPPIGQPSMPVANPAIPGTIGNSI